jgi:hypothetical protein
VRQALFETIELCSVQMAKGRFAGVAAASEEQWQFDIFDCGKSVEKLERLKHEAHFISAELG